MSFFNIICSLKAEFCISIFFLGVSDLEPNVDPGPDPYYNVCDSTSLRLKSEFKPEFL